MFSTALRRVTDNITPNYAMNVAHGIPGPEQGLH